LLEIDHSSRNNIQEKRFIHKLNYRIIPVSNFRLLFFITLLGYLCCFSGAFSMAQIGDDGFRFEQSELAQLYKGEVIVRSDESDKRRVQAAILIDSPAQPIWSVLTDCNHTPEFIPKLKSCRILQPGENTRITEQQVKISTFLPRVTYVIQSDYQKFRRIDFKKVSGDLKALEGSWVLEEIGDGRYTILVYSVFLDPGFFIPQGMVQRTLQNDLPNILLAVRNRVSRLSPQ
jgi:ribosome-associated toxin RatA of RatAB toxin-antitoxin module